MKVKTPEGHPVLIPFENGEAYMQRGYKKRASKAFTDWMKEHCGPLGVLWSVRHGVEGYTVFFVREEHAVHAKLRWGGI